jgi:hypothetical protein
MWHKWGRRGTCIGYWLESQRRNRPLGRRKCRWVDNIKMDLVETEWGGADWICLAKERTCRELL